MNIKLLIVDDRKEVADRISKAIQWSKYEIVPSTAYNGQDAMKIILDENIDIVITDIEMPVMSGLELAEECQKRKLPTKIIILSGYDNFAYAKQALSLGVCEYLLKPVSMENMLQTVLKIKQKFEEEQQAIQDECKQHRQALHSLPMLKKEIFQELLEDNVDWEKLRERAELANLKVKTDDVCVALLEPAWWKDEKTDYKTVRTFRFGLSNMAYEIFLNDFPCDVFRTPKGMLAVVMNYPPAEKPLVIQYNAYQRAVELQKAVNQYYDMELSIAISGCCRGNAAVKTAYQECMQLLSTGVQEDKNVILMKSDNMQTTELEYPEKLAEEILRAFSLNDLENTLKKTKELCSELLKNRRLPPVELKNRLCHLLIKLGYAKGIESNIFDLSTEFLELSTMEEIEKWMCSHIRSMGAQKEEQPDQKERIEMMKKYIEENYNRSISLKEMSENLYISESYLSLLFKEYIGVNFSQYVINLRIEKAKELLKEKKYKIYEIAQMVGYTDTRYFSEAFRKNTGMLPKQWMQQQK